MRKEEKQTYSSLKDLISQQLDTLSKGKFGKSIQLQSHWDKVVGPNIANHCQVLYVKGNCLYVGVENSTWMNEISFMTPQILQQIEKLYPEHGIQDLKFKLRPKN